MVSKGFAASITLSSIVLLSAIGLIQLKGKLDDLDKHNIHYSVFENAKICRVENGEEGVWESYKESNIPKSGPNWRSYFYRTYELNNGNLERDTLNIPCEFEEYKRSFGEQLRDYNFR